MGLSNGSVEVESASTKTTVAMATTIAKTIQTKPDVQVGR